MAVGEGRGGSAAEAVVEDQRRRFSRRGRLLAALVVASVLAVVVASLPDSETPPGAVQAVGAPAPVPATVAAEADVRAGREPTAGGGPSGEQAATQDPPVQAASRRRLPPAPSPTTTTLGPTSSTTTTAPPPSTTSTTAPVESDDSWGTDPGAWTSMPAAPIAGRWDHAMIWTGTEVLVLAGNDPHRPAHSPALTDAAAYNPATGRWRKLADAPPLDGWGTEAVWTGREAILWGGYGHEGFALGAAYDPAADRWRTLPDAPILPRHKETMVWTGTEAIVWGGAGYDVAGQPPHAVGDGAAYNPATNTWRKLTPSPLNGRAGHTAVWTGSRMIVWGGGSDGPLVHPAGAAYDPVADRWEVLPEAPFAARRWHAAVWTGDRMLVFGGEITRNDSLMSYDDGAAYDPAARRWEMLPRSPLGRRVYATSVWTGRQMVIWGGSDESYWRPVPDGAAYDPATRRWTVLASIPLEKRNYHRMVWTGTDVVIWGGYRLSDPNNVYDDGASFRPTG